MSRFPIALTAILLALATAAAPAGAEPLKLRPGEEATVLVDDGGRVSVAAQRPAAPLSEFDRAAVRQLTGGTQDYAVGPNAALLRSDDGSLPTPEPVARGAIRIAFVRLPDGKSLLIIENGYGRAMSYRATITRDEKAQPTDVCQVIPEKRGYEHWPYPIGRIELTDIRLEPWYPTSRIRCE